MQCMHQGWVQPVGDKITKRLMTFTHGIRLKLKFLAYVRRLDKTAMALEMNICHSDAENYVL